MAEPEPKLNQKQERTIIALLNEPSIQKAAAAAEVGERTIYDWLKEETFSAEYRRARRDAFSQAIGMCMRYSPLASNTLAKIASDANAPASARVSASSALLKFSREGIELEDLEVRVKLLEQATK